MSGLFSTSFSIVAPLPPENLVALLRHKLAPAQNWSDWLVRDFTHPFRGHVSDDGFDLWTHYAKLTPHARGTFAPAERGTRVDVEVNAVGATTWVLYGMVLTVLGMPVAASIAYGVWLLSLGHNLWPLFVLAPLVFLLFFLFLIFGSLAIAASLALQRTRTQLTHWLTDTLALHAVGMGG